MECQSPGTSLSVLITGLVVLVHHPVPETNIRQLNEVILSLLIHTLLIHTIWLLQ